MPLRILEKHPEQCFTIPMTGSVRSLNLANAVSIVLYEALRQTSQESGVGSLESGAWHLAHLPTPRLPTPDSRLYCGGLSRYTSIQT